MSKINDRMVKVTAITVILWGCVLAALLLINGCAGERFGHPDQMTYNIFDQPWPGAEGLHIVERPLLDPITDCHGDPIGCAQYDPATKTCTIWLSPTAGKYDVEHEEFHCLDAHLKTEETTHRYAEERARVKSIALSTDPIGDPRDWWVLDPAKSR